MLRTALAVLVACLTMLTAAPPAQAAAHFAAWDSDGVATDLAGNTYLFRVKYHGFCTNSFTVELRTLSGTLVESRRFAGNEQLQDLTVGPYTEAFSATGQSTTAGITFAFSGMQWWWLNNGPMYNVIRGTYQGLTFAAESVLEPWVFCS